jgi:AcrR family transcriptional regulator
MAIIVDKEQKKKDIAFACKEIIIEKGIHDLTISRIAQTAGIGKGTFYEYFKSKEELLFELVNLLMFEYNIKKEIRLSEVESTKNKIKIFADFFYDEESKDLRVLYKMFIGISLLSPEKEMVDFQTECFNYYYQWFERLIQEGIDKKEIPPQTIVMAKGLFSMAKGLFIASETTHSVQDVKTELDLFIDTLFEVIEIKECK